MSEQFLYFLQQMFNGVTLGSTYALIAIGYTMVYGIIGMINFAHGEVYMIGSYVSFMIIAALMMMGIDSSWLLVAAGFVGAIVIASAYGWSIERVAYRPVRSSKRPEDGQPARHQYRSRDCADLCDWRGNGGGSGRAARSVLWCN